MGGIEWGYDGFGTNDCHCDERNGTRAGSDLGCFILLQETLFYLWFAPIIEVWRNRGISRLVKLHGIHSAGLCPMN